ncbi:hypothetical protein niasHS_007471 [Heterodera schachtii]|uniref:Apple domain-containing protein n=1 Tax=Heterodera schachtii TaxID=97005 RepID=A0ABD2JXK7_HETSC
MFKFVHFFCSLATFPLLISAISSNCFYLPHIVLNGGTYDEFNASEIKHCCIACARDPCCIAYTYDKELGRCFMKSAISDSYKHSGMTSGLKANTHAGQGALLRNIRIAGGTASAVVHLPNTEDCMQYCTAYGIFSWSPLPPSSTTTTASSNVGRSASSIVPTSSQQQQQGECSCMSRISSLEYSFGSRSAIFPPVSNL